MLYSKVALVFENIEKESSRLAITALLSELFQEASWQEVQAISYFSRGTIRPAYKGMQFNFAKKWKNNYCI